MESSGPLLTATLLTSFLALSFGFSNGFRDSSSIIATVVSTRALSANRAFFLCAACEFLGAFLIGSAIVATIGKGLFKGVLSADPWSLILIVSAALMATIAWGLISWWRAWPTSNNQALLAGLVGATAATLGLGFINHQKVLIVFLVLVTSPLLGFTLSFVITTLIRKVGEWMTPQAKKPVQVFQIASCMLVSAAHGSNDGQIILGLIVLALGISLDPGSDQMVAARLLVALFISSGVMLGGKRLLKKMGMKFYHIKPTQGLGAQLTSALTILGCASTGFPASTMQVITGSVVGAGVAKNHKAIRWHIAKEIVISWVITFPIVSAMGYGIGSLLYEIFP